MIEAGISTVIIIGAAAMLAGAAYGMSALPKAVSLSIQNLDYDFPMVLRYNATANACFSSGNSSCESAILPHFRYVYGLAYLSYESQGVYAHSGNESDCGRGSVSRAYCFAAFNDTLSCIYACGD